MCACMHKNNSKMIIPMVIICIVIIMTRVAKMISNVKLFTKIITTIIKVFKD